MFLLREVRPEDLDDLEELAGHLNTLNLPANRERLERIIEVSQDSFNGKLAEHRAREYVFVMYDLTEARVVGTGMIIAQHGTYRRPAVYFNVRKEQKYSETLDKYFVHQVLQLTFNYDGATEIGGLILHPDYQGHPRKLGKLLSFVRFLYIGMHRSWFRDQIIAELLPPLNPDGTSELWNCLGANFTGLDYTTADKLSRENVEFIRSLFPLTPIYTALLPRSVRDMIGKVGAPTKPVERMLQSIGFRYDHSIDPFDGGPTFAVETDQCELVRRTHWARYVGPLDAEAPADGVAFIGREGAEERARFRATVVEFAGTPNGYRLRGDALAALELQEGTSIGIMPLSGGGLQRLY